MFLLKNELSLSRKKRINKQKKRKEKVKNTHANTHRKTATSES
jgi:hypothetical protein